MAGIHMKDLDHLKEEARRCLEGGRPGEAVRLLLGITGGSGLDTDATVMLGEAYCRSGNVREGLRCLGAVLQAQPENPEACLQLGRVYHGLGRKGEAENFYKRALQLKPGMADACIGLGDLHREQGSYDLAEQYYAQAIGCRPDDALSHFYRANMQKIQGRTEAAVRSYDTAILLNRDFPEAYWNRARILPVIYDNQEHVEASRREYADSLGRLAAELRLDTPAQRLFALKGVLSSTNFYLQYQGKNDLELQKQYGEIVHRVMQSNFPQWSQPVPSRRTGSGGRIRIGYSTAFLWNNNGAVWLLGWLRNRNRERFEIYCYHTGTMTDHRTEEFRALCDHFRHIPGDLIKACEQISADELHILVYPELGIDAQSMAMAGLYLAPVQCAGWGHPITTGLPTIKYWLSSDLMEPHDGEAHYSERLVRLPNLGNCYSRRQYESLAGTVPAMTRKDFGLRDDAVVYLCSQSLFKYLPEYDALLPEIAARMPDAQFVFLAISSVHVVRRFMARLDRAFKQAGMEAARYCTMLNRQTHENYLALNRLSDVFLDNPPWSGNNTTLAAVDCRLPIVALPTQFMRGRHSYGILDMLEMSDLAAGSRTGYVSAAVKLGNYRDWRDAVRERIDRNADALYDDTACVKGLEEFYQACVMT